MIMMTLLATEILSYSSALGTVAVEIILLLLLCLTDTCMITCITRVVLGGRCGGACCLHTSYTTSHVRSPT